MAVSVWILANMIGMSACTSLSYVACMRACVHVLCPYRNSVKRSRAVCDVILSTNYDAWTGGAWMNAVHNVWSDVYVWSVQFQL